MNSFTPLAFRKTWQSCPENLFGFPLDVLIDGMQTSHEAKVAVIAELFVRVFLSGNQDSREAEIINTELSNKELCTFLVQFDGQHFSEKDLQKDFWDSADEFSQCCMAAVRKRFQLLFRAEGMIPVYLGEDAFFIPFHFSPNNEGAGNVYDLQKSINEPGKGIIPEWSEYSRQLGITADVILHCHCKNGLQLTGNSMMLPLQLAWWRRNKALPQYNVFRLVATGAFDRDMRLVPVATEEKLRGAKEKLQDATFVYPQSSTDNKGGFPLKALDRDAVLEEVRWKAESLDKLDLDYAFHRLEGMSREVRLTNYTNWPLLIERLENAAAFDRHNPEQKESYLVNMILRGEAYCHAGRTCEATKINEAAMDFAEKNGFLRQLLILKIDRLVLYQDMEAFNDIQDIYLELREKIAAMHDNTDLLMRYYGTMGQAFAYGALINVEGFTAKEALKCFEMAIEYAENTAELPEIAHDKNYAHLYYALFEPDSFNEKEAFRDARAIIQKLYGQDENEAVKNLYYLKRSQALAWYRQLLLKGKLPEYHIDSDFMKLLYGPQGSKATPWIRACVGKCLGAMEAANGNRENAMSLFEEATNAIEEEKEPSVLTIIHLATCAEAYRSLGMQKYLEKGKELLKQIPGNDIARHSLPLWRAYFENPTADFPGKYYWY